MIRTNYVMIDYENVQPTDIGTLQVPNVKVLLFLGANQKKLSVELVIAFLAMKGTVQIVRCSKIGANALDFHIAFYCGEIAAQDKNASLHIVSRDTGFDPLIEHLRLRKVPAQRVASLQQIAHLKTARTNSQAERVDLVLDRIQGGGPKPRSLKTLANAVSSMFQKSLDEQEVEAIVKELQKREVFTVENGKLVYAIEGAGAATA